MRRSSGLASCTEPAGAPAACSPWYSHRWLSGAAISQALTQESAAGPASLARHLGLAACRFMRACSCGYLAAMCDRCSTQLPSWAADLTSQAGHLLLQGGDVVLRWDGLQACVVPPAQHVPRHLVLLAALRKAGLPAPATGKSHCQMGCSQPTAQTASLTQAASREQRGTHVRQAASTSQATASRSARQAAQSAHGAHRPERSAAHKSCRRKGHLRCRPAAPAAPAASGRS